jgi:hypothetical protein
MELEKWGNQGEEGATDDVVPDEDENESGAPDAAAKGETAQEEGEGAVANGVSKLSLDERDPRPDQSLDR